jgi:predicted nucleic acid-binding protein
MSVSAKVEIVIKDACILFDLMDLGLLSSFYQLPLVVVTTPYVLAEIMNEDQMTEIGTYVQSGQLQVDQFSSLEDIDVITAVNRGLSPTDASVIETATRRAAAILSSDGGVRNESVRRGLKVIGLLWVLEELYKQQLLSIETVMEKLSRYPEVNKRAPISEIANLRKRLEKMVLEK